MSEAGRVWQLVRGDGLLAELVVTGGDFPWLNATVRPAADFEEVRPLLHIEGEDAWWRWSDEPFPEPEGGP